MTVNCKNGGTDLSFAANEADASTAIACLHGSLVALGVPHQRNCDVKIALAEAINNVVEHAYAGNPQGRVQVRATMDRNGLSILITDRGRPLPGLRVPDGVPASVETAREDLPEGGFGWFLIRQLCDNVRYDRTDGENRLRLSFDFSATEKRPQ